MASLASLSSSSAEPDIQYRQDNTIIFTMVRMNPPTPGHLEVISNLINIGLNSRYQYSNKFRIKNCQTIFMKS